jgi:hypothetical protein
MEYVDNCLDCADEMTRAAAAAAAKGGGDGAGVGGAVAVAEVHVAIDLSKRSVWIRDNALGMSPEFLADLVCGIGESKKKAVPWLNGQFGFGVHAFRAAAKRLVVYSKREGESVYKLALGSAQVDGIPAPHPLDPAALAADKELLRAHEIGLFDAFELSRLVPNEAGESGNGEGAWVGHPWEGGAGSVILGHGAVSGTSVLVEGIDKVWFDTISAHTLSTEIERHFESLLARPNLTVVVSEAGKRTTRIPCLPFDYTAVQGKRISKTIVVAGAKINKNADGSQVPSVECNLVVSRTMVPGKKARFFKNGRCIAAVADTRSFMQSSSAKATLWDHPAICGYIEVGGLLDPAITRDEFTKSSNRQAVYQALLPLEKMLQEALDEVLIAQADESFAELEDILSKAVSEVSRIDSGARKADNGEANDAVSSDIEGSGEHVPDDTEIKDDAATYTTIKSKKLATPKVKADGSLPPKKPLPRNEVRFVKAEVHGDELPKRSFAAGNCVYINIDHADFTTRVDKDGKGRLKFGPRVSAYLANELACHYRMNFYDKHRTAVPDDRLSLYGELCDSVNKVEDSLTRKIGTLERRMRSAARYNPKAKKAAARKPPAKK